MNFDEGLCEFALRVQTFIDAGWKLTCIEYGDHRFGRSAELVCKRGDETKSFSPGDLESWVSDEWRRQQDVEIAEIIEESKRRAQS
jgi:hypothetical protein